MGDTEGKGGKLEYLKELELGEIGENYATMQLLLKEDEAVETREKRAKHCMGMQGTVRF